MTCCSTFEGTEKHYLTHVDAVAYDRGAILIQRYLLDTCGDSQVYVKRLRANKYGMYWIHSDRVNP